MHVQITSVSPATIFVHVLHDSRQFVGGKQTNKKKNLIKKFYVQA